MGLATGWALLLFLLHGSSPVSTFKVLQVDIPDTEAAYHVAYLGHHIDYLVNPIPGAQAIITTDPSMLNYLELALKSANLNYTWFDWEEIEVDQRSKTTGNGLHNMTWTNYHSYEDMLSYAEYLQQTHRNLVSIVDIGKTYEGRALKVIQVCRTGRCGKRPGIWIDGGIHAREWISSATVMFLLKQLVETSQGKRATYMLDWYLMPMANPDGYAYSRDKYRLWRKNRRPNFAYTSFYCTGVDLNRNYDFRFGEAASQDPCSSIYEGPAAFSEPETESISMFVMQKKEVIKAFFTLHSYSQLILIPYAMKAEPNPPYFADMIASAEKAERKMRTVHNTSYIVAQTHMIFSNASGGGEDWACNKAHIPYAMTIELRPKIHDYSSVGFLLPREDIIPQGEEMWAFMLSMSQDIEEKFTTLSDSWAPQITYPTKRAFQNKYYAN